MTYNDLLQKTQDIIKNPLGKRDIRKLQKIGFMERYSLITFDIKSFDKDESRIHITRLEKKWDMISYARHLSTIPIPDAFIEIISKNITGEALQVFIAKEIFLSVPPDSRTIITTPRCGTFAQSNSRLLYQLFVSPLCINTDSANNIYTKKYQDSLLFMGGQLLDDVTGDYI